MCCYTKMIYVLFFMILLVLPFSSLLVVAVAVVRNKWPCCSLGFRQHRNFCFVQRGQRASREDARALRLYRRRLRLCFVVAVFKHQRLRVFHLRPAQRVDSILAARKVHVVGCFVSFQAVAALDLATFPRFRVLSFNLGNKLSRQRSSNGLGSLLLDSSRLAGLRHRVRVGRGPADVEHLVGV